MDVQLMQRAVPLLLEWYRCFKRDLPWRKTNDFYHVWVSEIMLQQTRVEAVKGYYERFFALFPTVQTLADAPEEEVLKAWEGLGYYSRARNLHKAAKQIAQNGVPTDYNSVRALQGIGDYTAGAICSIAYNLPCPAVDGNVIRVLSRLYADGRDTKETKEDYATLLKECYTKEAGEFCQSLMELGAIVCVPNGEPLCADCPLKELCSAHLKGEEMNYPLKEIKKPRKTQEYYVYVLKHNGKYALQKREQSGLLASLWQFPMFQTPKDFGKILAQKNAKHIFTHIEWHMAGYLVEASEAFDGYVWATKEEIKNVYAVPSAFKAFLPWIK